MLGLFSLPKSPTTATKTANQPNKQTLQGQYYLALKFQNTFIKLSVIKEIHHSFHYQVYGRLICVLCMCAYVCMYVYVHMLYIEKTL